MPRKPKITPPLPLAEGEAVAGITTYLQSLMIVTTYGRMFKAAPSKTDDLWSVREMTLLNGGEW